MIEKLVDAILTSEKYTVRLLDEVAHKLINKPVKYFEQNGIPRNKQALYLDLMTLFGTLNAAFIWSRQDFNYAKAHALKLPVWAVLLGVSFFDADKLKYSRNTQNQGGVLSNPEVVSYNSISGIIRPYMLASSIGSIIYGLYNNNYDFLESGMIVLPLSLSFYVRDSSSGGLLKHASQLIRNSIISRVPSA